MDRVVLVFLVSRATPAWQARDTFIVSPADSAWIADVGGASAAGGCLAGPAAAAATGLLLLRAPPSPVNVGFGAGDPETRCAVRSFGADGRLLWSSIVAAIKALPCIPAADVIGFRDASARKPFTLLGADSVRSLFALDCIASAVQELRAEGFQVDVRSGCTWARVPQWPMSALLIRGAFRSVYLWEGACRETDAVLFREAFGLREAAAVAPVHPAAPSAFDVRGSPQLELRSTAIDMAAATVSACYNALPEHGQQQHREEVLASLRFLGHASDALRTHGKNQLDGTRIRAASKILNAVMLATRLHDSAHLEGVLRGSIRHCLRKSIADPILENLKSGGLVSSSTMQRYFVVFDAALLLADQMRFATNPPPAEYMLSDSSPLLGTDWLLTETF
ncbi:unnamed protein product, partial [Prorocentrum cordatum]